MILSGRRTALFAAGVLIAATIVGATYPSGRASAADQITARKLTLQNGATDGASKAGGTVNHLFGFTLPSVGDASVGSIKFQYCTIAVGTCDLPTGLVTTGATLGAETGATGFAITATTNGSPYLHRTAAAVTAGTAVTYRLDGVVNPTTENESFFVRITTYLSEDTTGTAIDAGVVTASTATQIVLTGIMPESLIFCTGEDISVNGGGIPDCSTATDGTIDFNQLFSPSDTATAKSEMAASTNATSGYSITVSGGTMASGSNTIAAMAAAGAGVRGTAQFGLNLKLNTVTTSTPAVGAEVNPAANSTNFRGQAAVGYNTVDTFKFASGESVANSANGGAGPTDSQIFTVSYIVNVPGSQIAGTYTTTLTYTCTATF